MDENVGEFFVGEPHIGRPDCSGRTDKEIAVYDMLDSLGVEYTVIDHDPAASVDTCDEIERKLGVKICKNLFLCDRKKTRFFMLSMPGEKHFVTRDFSHAIESPRLSFAPPEKMLEFLNITPGSVSVLGLMNDSGNDVKYYIDSDLMTDEFFGCHPCINTSSLKIRMSDVLTKIIPATNHDYSVYTPTV